MMRFPDEVSIFQGVGISESLKRADFAAEEAMQVRANQVSRAFGRQMTGLT